MITDWPLIGLWPSYVFTLEERPLRRAYEAEKAKHAEAAAAAVEAERLRVESEADAERRRVENQKLLERLLAEQRRKLEGQSERLGADALHAERLQKERLERELTKHAAELKAAKAELQALKLAAAANQREAQATLEKMREEAEAAQRGLESESNRIRKELSATSSRLAAEKEGRQGAEAKATAEEKGRLAAEKELAAVLAKAQWNAACAEKAEAAHVATIKALKEELKEELKAAQKDKSPRHARPPKERGRGSRSLPGGFDFEEGPFAPPVSVQLATALRKNAGKVLDLFRDWDTDGDGQVQPRRAPLIYH